MMDDPTFTGPLIWAGALLIILIVFTFMARATMKDKERDRAEQAAREQAAAEKVAREQAAAGQPQAGAEQPSNHSA